MHPILLSEIHQSKRYFWMLFIVYPVLILLTRYSFGSTGCLILMGLFISLFNISLGVGAFSEEISKSRLQFLYLFPVRRSHCWIIKIAFGLFAGFLLALIFCLLLVLIPAGGERSSFFEFSTSNIMTLFGLLVMIGILLYAVGLFSVSFCLHPNLTFLFILPFILLIPFILLMVYLYLGLFPSVPELMILMLITSIPLFAGSYCIFKHRNPFLEQKWKWRKIAAVFTVITFLILALSYELLGIRKRQASAHYYYGIKNFSISPDGKYIYVNAFKSSFMCDHYLLDSQGNLVMDLGRVFNDNGAREIWFSESAGHFLIYDESDDFRSFITPESTNYTPLRLVNILNRKIVDVTNLNLNDKEYQYVYHTVTHDGQFLCGHKFKNIKYRTMFSEIFKQNISTGQIEYSDISDRDKYIDISTRFLQNDLARINKKYQHDRPSSSKNIMDKEVNEPNDTITLMDLNNFSMVVYTVPKYTVVWEISPEGKTLIALQRIPFENYVEYHLIALELADQKITILLKPPDLPRLDFQDFLKDREDNINFNISPHGRWIWFDDNSSKPKYIKWLIDWRENKRYKLLEYEYNYNGDQYHKSLQDTIYTNDESRIGVVFSYTQNQNNIIQKNWTQLEIYDWNGNGFAKTYSHELPSHYYNLKFLFLDDNRILFIKPGKPKFPFETDELWVLHLDTGKKHRFFQQTPTPP